jgi:ribonuclease Z
VNHPFGDPGLLLEFQEQRRVLLFDLGDISVIPKSTLLKVSDVFVSHTHIDHFIGFDRLLRMVFGQGRTLRLYGPKNFIANVEGKLAGFTWNLVDRYEESLNIEVREVHANRIHCARFRAIDKFQRSEEWQEDFIESLLWNEDGFCVSTAILEHRIPCLGFALNEDVQVNIDKDKLQALNYSAGPWLNELKQAILESQPEDTMITVPMVGVAGQTQSLSLRQLQDELTVISPGQKIAYIVDTVYNEKNNARIVDLVRGATLFFCESPFIAEEEERARERCHLTSRQAGLLAREAGVEKLVTFHFSPRHTFHQEQLIREAEEAFGEPINPSDNSAD